MLDSDDDSDAVPNSAGPAPPAKALSTKTLDQLQYEACLTDDVLHFLSTAVFARHRGLHPPGARVHLKDPLWFDADAPPSLPRFLFQDERLKDATIYMPARIDTSHRVLVRIVVKAVVATAAIYASHCRLAPSVWPPDWRSGSGPYRPRHAPLFYFRWMTLIRIARDSSTP